MDPFLQGVLTALLPALAVALISPYLTVRFTLKQFYTEKWWEKKADAYIELLKRLAAVCRTLELWVHDDVGLSYTVTADTYDEQATDALNVRYAQEVDALKDAYAVASIVVTQRTVEAVSQLLGEMNYAHVRQGPYETIEEMHYKQVNECIKKVRAEAQKDLRRPKEGL